MKYLIFALMMSLLLVVSAKESDAKRKPNQMEQFIGQVQFCEGTEALGNEGQGMGASAFINVFSEMNSTVKPVPLKCELAFAVAYEYGNDRGFKIGEILPFNLTALPSGKTECQVRQENGETFLQVTKAQSPNAKIKRAPKVLVEKCKLTINGF